MAMRDEIIVRNSVRCLGCGDEIVSGHRHDFKYCSCGAVAVDGGQAYTRRLFKSGSLWLDTSIYAEPDPTKEELIEGAAMLRWINSGARPPDDAWATAPVLDDWKILPARRPPAAEGMSEIEGTVSGHPDFRDGQRIRTTPLLFESKDRPRARTVTRFWRLGTPARETLQ
jgi:hypothetical protein